ncbi:MAG: hypothetical protein H0T44_16350 [Gemmatimonadales bacterium]|nr:hypothetical protein [Gemmatimonadales bacterium]
MEPAGFSIGTDGTTNLEVHLTARDRKGNLLLDKTGGHIFRIEDGLVRRFDIRQGRIGKTQTETYPAAS